MNWIQYVIMFWIAAIGSFIGTTIASFVLIRFLREWTLTFHEMLRQQEKKNGEDAR